MNDLIKEARELCEKASPAPWKIDDFDDCFIEPRICQIPANGCYDYNTIPGNSAFIARSRTLVPELADALEKANAEITAMQTELAQLREAQRWIPVSEPPKESGAYWVNLHQEDKENDENADFCVMAWYWANPLIFAPQEVGWQLLNEWYQFSDSMRQYITHWCKLPAPPADGGGKE